MAGGWRMLVLMVGLAALACVAQSRANYEEIVTQALQIFNQGQRGQPLFRLVQTFPAPGLVISKSPWPLQFQIKETVCQANQQRESQNCAFRDNGEERQCSGAFVVHGQVTRALLVRCDQRFQPGGPRVRRSAEEPTSSTYEKAKEMYERAKYEIIGNILRNF
ncbi:15 kDa protein B-like [Suncus etruscus]|uniref:15 kDa protein B-like n=1 Tax=Suncus etruscus TaxID=109475 RepID=UPI00210F939B|nr:15 kDa protein B-like [Suncus etruscus]